MTGPLQRFISTKSLTKDESISNAPAVADRVIESLAGRARVLWELATGVNTQYDSGYRLNPQGKRGTDLSGPPWGPALKHTVLQSEWHIQGGGDIYTGKKPVMNFTLAPSSVNQPMLKKLVFEVRPFERRTNAPYSRLGINMFAVSDAGTPTLRVRTYVANKDGSIDPEKIICESTFNCSTSGVFSNFATSSVYVPCSPGINYLAVEVTCTAISTAANVEVHAIFASQTVERGH